MMLTQTYPAGEMLQMTCFMRRYDFDQLVVGSGGLGHKKTSRGGGFTIRVTNVFRFPKTGLFVGMHNCLDGFPQALPEIKNGKVTDYKKV